MELTERELEVLKSLLITEINESDEMLALCKDPQEKKDLKEFYDDVKSIYNKMFK